MLCRSTALAAASYKKLNIELLMLLKFFISLGGRIKLLVAVSVCCAVLLSCAQFVSTVLAEETEPEPKPFTLPPVETLTPDRKPADPDIGNPAYRPANVMVVKARELLSILQIDESLLRKTLQGIEFGEEDIEVLLEMLFRLPQVDIERLETLVQPLPDWDKLNEETPRYLGGVYRLRGIVSKFEDLTPHGIGAAPSNPDETLDGSLKRLAERRTIPQVYRTQILVPGLKAPLEIYSNRVPRAWLKKKATGEKLAAWQGGQLVEAWGLLLKQGSAASGPAYYFAAPRIRWYKDTPLGKLGFDYELFDDVQQKRTLLINENEVFYEFLAIANRTPPEVYDLAKPLKNEIVELWRKPEDQVGNLLSFRGVTRHVTRIAVEDPELAQRLGFDHYYYLELFVPLSTPTVVQIPIVVKDEDGSELNVAALADPADPRYVQLAKTCAVTMALALRFDLVHFDSMPLVFYFHELPPGETVQTLKNKSVQVRGFFLKSWRYQSNVPLTNKQHASLFGPLLMGYQPEVYEGDSRLGANIPGILILTVIGGTVLVGIIYLWLNRRDHEQRPTTLPDKIGFDPQNFET